jgi:hypothetical protein
MQTIDIVSLFIVVSAVAGITGLLILTGAN